MEAHFTQKTSTRPAELAFAITKNGTRVWTVRVLVTGKREARALAVAAGATPWNF